MKDKDLTALMGALEQNQLILREIGLRYGVASGNDAQPSLDSSKAINTPQDVYNRVRKEMGDFPQEHLRVFLLNTKNVVLDEQTIYVGNVKASIVRPAEVLRPAILASATSIIICHNHPSGDPEPSQEDVKITRTLAAAGKLMGIEIIDHVVIGRDGVCQHDGKEAPSMTKVHYRSAESTLLFCSGRPLAFGLHTRSLDEVTCRACRRELVKKALSSPDAAAAS